MFPLPKSPSNGPGASPQQGERHDRLEKLTQAFAGSISRRHTLRLLGAVAVGAWAAPRHPAVSGMTKRHLSPPNENCPLISMSGVLPESCTVQYPPKNLNDCPNKRHHPGHISQSNGCGAAGSHYPVPQSFFGTADFTPGCREHDCCYGTCNSPKYTCDFNFGHALAQSCEAAYPAASQILKRAACVNVAADYVSAVAFTSKGTDAYTTAQREDCECCFPNAPTAQIYCNCNQKCYTDLDTCYRECHGINCLASAVCGPALSGQCPG